jgi:hypothetical protein
VDQCKDVAVRPSIKACFASKCGLCDKPFITGERISKTHKGWAHHECMMADLFAPERLKINPATGKPYLDPYYLWVTEGSRELRIKRNLERSSYDYRQS